MAYSEHVGTYLHDGGSKGEISHLYPRSIWSSSFCATCLINCLFWWLRRQLLLDHRESLAHFPQQIRKIYFQNRLLGVNHHIYWHRGCHRPEPHRFPQAPFDPVALDRPAQNSSDRESDSQPACLRPAQIKHRHMSRKVSSSFFVHALEISMPQQSQAARKLPTQPPTRPIVVPLRGDVTHGSPRPKVLRRPVMHGERKFIRGTRASLKPACDPWPGDAKSLPDRPWSSCAYGIRASSSDDAGWAGMCAWAWKIAAPYLEKSPQNKRRV